MTSDAIDPRELETEIEEPGHPPRSTREHEIMGRAYEIYLAREYNLAVSWKTGFRPSVSSRLSSAAQADWL
jgi:hypothetical protein